ncbi:DNA repair protein [Coniochaeta ligniaria NRRL 30616]|uniref:DNA repair protein RAD14 n=1 Tax=Coniochaeta ligniaria NRRL 30616 TaxID=1408157 RepID=A0A1J7I5Y6_9PEZI|nr:DNA repair protein [Coniochaeta ligniaria NRRL 30616]
MERPSTPPRQPQAPSATVRSPPTPEVTRRIEESRLRAKALRDQKEASQRAAGAVASQPRTSSGFVATADIQLAGPAGRKRPHSDVVNTRIPSTVRDARSPAGKEAAGGDDTIRPAKKFTKFVDYNFSAMTDTKGGFLSTEDDPHNKSMSAPAPPGPGGGGGPQEQRPAHMTADEWERMQVIKKLKRQKAGPYEPGLSVLTDEKERKKCRECGSIEIDWVWEEVFHVCVCGLCKEKFPEKYSLLTKTECKQDYLLTDPELRDADLLPHLSRPNPHKSHWHDMMLFLRFQVEEYAFTKKWGSADGLDAEFEKREADKRSRKETKFKEKLLDLKKKTRTDRWIKDRAGKKLGDVAGRAERHVHEWGRTVENEKGMTVKTCLSCGMEVEELEF